MKIRLLRNCVVRGVPSAIGDVIDVSQSEAHTLFNLKRAILFKPAPDPEPFPLPERVEEVAPVEHRDPEITPAKRRGRPPKSNG